MLNKKKVKDNVIVATYKSSNITESSYDINTKELIVEFNNARKYTFVGVPLNDYQQFEKAESQGKAFNKHIKKYPIRK